MFDAPASLFAFFLVTLAYSIGVAIWLCYGVVRAVSGGASFGPFAAGCGLAGLGFICATLVLWLFLHVVFYYAEFLRTSFPRADWSSRVDVVLAWLILPYYAAVLTLAFRLPFRRSKRRVSASR